MSHFTELPQISDVSSISTISHSSSRFGRVDSSQSLLDHYSSITSNNRFAMAQGTNPIEKVTKSLTLCRENIGEHIKANIIYQCVKEASLNHGNILSEATANKLKALLLTYKLAMYMNLPSSAKHMQGELTLLGINELPLSDLSLDEKLEAKCCIETMLREKIYNVILRYEACGGNIKEVLKNNECNMHSKFLEGYNTQLVEWKNRIEELTLEYENILLKYTDLMDNWNKLKYKDMSQVYLERSEHLLLQMQVAELQAKITKLSCMIKMFKETPTTVDAFKMLNQVIEKKLKVIMDEIRQKENLKKLYDNLKNTEYDEILKTYSELCKAIKKKKQILNTLK